MNEQQLRPHPIGFQATLDLIVRGPVITKSSAIGPWGCDMVFSRDPAGRLLFSGDHVQGKLREIFDRIKAEAFRDEQEKLRSRNDELIATGATTEDWEESRSRQLSAAAKRYPAVFSDFIALAGAPGPGEHTITRVKIDDDSGAAAEGALRVIDCPVAPGEQILFRGDVRFFAACETTAWRQLDTVLSALRSIASLGADQSVGMGSLIGVGLVRTCVTRFLEIVARAAAIQTSDADLHLSFADPLCCPRGVVNGNIFESEDDIPGEAIKGAVAHCLRQITGLTDVSRDLGEIPDSHPFGLLCRHLDKVFIRRARPSPASGVRNCVPPLSLAFLDDQLADMALAPTDKLVNGSAPAFVHDWKAKQSTIVNERFGKHYPSQELRVRTAIESPRRRAKDHNLFAYRLIRPEGTVWKTRVTTKPGADAETDSLPTDKQLEVMRQLNALLGTGWLHVGKTSARGTGALAMPQPSQDPAPILLAGKPHFVVTLQAPAVMLDPRRLWSTDHADGPSLDELYAEYWQEQCPDLKPLSDRRYVKHRLVGGYQAWRFRFEPTCDADLSAVNRSDRVGRQRTLPYNPSLLTEEGSVFVFTVQPAAIDACVDKLAEWCRHGLDLPSWAVKAYGATHHTNPFRPDVGYGEIAVNLPCHLELAASNLKKNRPNQ